MDQMVINGETGEITVVPLTADEIAEIQARAASDAIPKQVPLWSAQAALKMVSKYDAVDAYILSVKDTNPAAYFAWTMGNFAVRDSAFIATLKSEPSIAMSDADIDTVFKNAAQIALVAG